MFSRCQAWEVERLTTCWQFGEHTTIVNPSTVGCNDYKDVLFEGTLPRLGKPHKNDATLGGSPKERFPDPRNSLEHLLLPQHCGVSSFSVGGSRVPVPSTKTSHLGLPRTPAAPVAGAEAKNMSRLSFLKLAQGAPSPVFGLLLTVAY